MQLAELAPEYFSTLGTWQKRYGRDNLQLSRPWDFLGVWGPSTALTVHVKDVQPGISTPGSASLACLVDGRYQVYRVPGTSSYSVTPVGPMFERGVLGGQVKPGGPRANLVRWQMSRPFAIIIHLKATIGTSRGVSVLRTCVHRLHCAIRRLG